MIFWNSIGLMHLTVIFIKFTTQRPPSFFSFIITFIFDQSTQICKYSSHMYVPLVPRVSVAMMVFPDWKCSILEFRCCILLYVGSKQCTWILINVWMHWAFRMSRILSYLYSINNNKYVIHWGGLILFVLGMDIKRVTGWFC